MAARDEIMTEELLLLSVIVLPVAGALFIALAGERHRNLREAITLLTATLLFIVVLLLYQTVGSNTHPVIEIIEPISGLAVALTVEPLGILFALVCSFLWIITSIYSIGYMRGNNEQNQTRFYVCFALAIASTMGVAFSANMFSLFVFYEMITLITYPLVTHSGTEEAKSAGRMYLGYLLGTSICLLLLAIIWTWSITGTLDFVQGGVFDNEVPDSLLLILYVLYVFGVGKAAMMPFHRWLPAAMVAPVPVSALLHAVAVVKAGVFTILKLTVYLFGIDELANAGVADWLLYVAGATILIASIIALRQDNLKARLAYSTVSQLSYVMMATAILAPLSIFAAALHIAAHAFGKITLFFAAGSIYTASHKTEVSQLDGIGWRMPWTMTAFAIGSLSMIGVPPTAGFLSKWFMLQGAFTVENWIAIGIIVISTLLNAAYFLPIIYVAFFRESDHDGNHGEAPVPIVLALTITALGTIMLFIMPEQLLSLIQLVKI
jgi:multicomponent Na+:H+ antiporter subunit D